MLVRLMMLMALLPAAVRAEERPPILPSRDVDITYIVPTPAGATRQHLRFNAERQLLRLDPPGGGIYVIIDFAAGRMSTVRDADRSVIEMTAPKTWMPGLGQAHYTRRNTSTVAGVPCTEWQTTDSEGRDVHICLDHDGVMLRVNLHGNSGAATLAVAVERHAEPQAPALFQVPTAYRRLAPPPMPGASMPGASMPGAR